MSRGGRRFAPSGPGLDRGCRGGGHRAARHDRARSQGAPGGGPEFHRERRGDRGRYSAGRFGGWGERGGARRVPALKRGRLIRSGVLVTAPAMQTKVETKKQQMT